MIGIEGKFKNLKLNSLVWEVVEKAYVSFSVCIGIIKVSLPLYKILSSCACQVSWCIIVYMQHRPFFFESCNKCTAKAYIFVSVDKLIEIEVVASFSVEVGEEWFFQKASCVENFTRSMRIFVSKQRHMWLEALNNFSRSKASVARVVR